ncbi:MAG: CinA family protein [Thermodesulfovibrionales bacterium]|nr:CinA family protein [Thermodesulfovibrionales bacterium]
METFGMELIEKIQEAFTSKGLRLSVAESATAGLLSHMLTSLPGASAFFDSSVVAYSAESKKNLLGIKKSFIEKHGVISEETARAMSEAVRDKTGSDFSLAVTGNTGPVAMEDKRVGLIFISVSHREVTTSRGFIFSGSRDEVRRLAAVAAIEFLYEAVEAYS